MTSPDAAARTNFNRKAAAIMARIALVFTALYLLVTFTPLVGFIVAAMDGDWHEGGGEVLVVLSGSMLVGNGGSQPPTMGADTYLRTVYARWVLRSQNFHTVVVTGTDGAAEAMAHYLELEGVSPEAILLEPRATSTHQNALYTRELLLQHYRTNVPPPVVVLTSDYHSWRAKHVFQKAGMQTEIIAIPDATKRVNAPLQRWGVFQLILSEWSKDLDYFLRGYL